MINGTYDIAVDTPKLHRRGTLALKSEGGVIAAVLNVGELGDLRFTGTCAGKEFTFAGVGEFGELGQVDYTASGSVWGSSIDVKCETSAGTVTIFGTQLSSSAGAAISSHDFIMSASAGDFTTGADTMYSGLYSDGS